MGMSVETKKHISIWHNWGIIISIYIALKPIYLNSSGSLQLCDMLMLLGYIYILISSKGKIIISSQIRPVLRPLVFFVFFVCSINGLWSVTGYNYSRYSLYYVFNLLAFLICYLIYLEIGLRRFKNALIVGAIISGFITSVGLIHTTGDVRSLGFFNNPNQLGYYGVVLVAIGFLYKEDRVKVQEIIIIILGIWCVISSMSKAAFFSIIIQCVLCTVFLDKNISIKTIIKKILLIVCIGFIIYLFVFTDIFSNIGFSSLARMKIRIFNMAYENDTRLGSGRGYNRIKELGIHFLWGMGEGNFQRFNVMKGAEVHSTYASIIVSYGLIGFLLYISFLWKCLSRNNMFLRNTAIYSGVLIYSISHNGVRNTLVWILLAAIFLCSYTQENGEMLISQKYEK